MTNLNLLWEISRSCAPTLSLTELLDAEPPAIPPNTLNMVVITRPPNARKDAVPAAAVVDSAI